MQKEFVYKDTLEIISEKFNFFWKFILGLKAGIFIFLLFSVVFETK